MRSLNVVVRRHQPFQFTRPEPEREGVDQVVGWSQKNRKEGKKTAYISPCQQIQYPICTGIVLGFELLSAREYPLSRIRGLNILQIKVMHDGESSDEHG